MIEQLNKKQQDAQFVDIYQSDYPFILKLCTARLAGNVDLAEDCTQETFYVLYKKYLAGVKVDNPRAFLAKTAHLILLNKTTRRTAEAAKRTALDESIPATSRWIEQLENRVILERLQASLNEKEQALFRLRYTDELSVAEIAAQTDSSVTAVTTRLSRLRRKLQQIVREREVTE